MYLRTLNLSKLLDKKSHFLFGPRAVGKSTLILQQLEKALVFDLLEAKTFQRLLKRPQLLEEESEGVDFIVIDEIQKIPTLLDEVHRLIQKKNKTFLLTGSSARKIKHGGANLLAGRARNAALFPLTSHEITDFDLQKYLNQGGIPEIYLSSEPLEDLESYVSNYLREEIKAEAVTRNVQNFSEFLDLVALSNGQEINMQSFANDCQVSPSTVKNYMGILEDTLLVFSVPPYKKTKKRKAVSRSKFYLFDIGVTNYLSKQRDVVEGSSAFGRNFEHLIALELRAALSYFRSHDELSYWRTHSKHEVDFLIGEKLAIEVKSTQLVQDKHLKGLRILREEGLSFESIVISFDSQKRTTEDGIMIYPWKIFLEELWGGVLIS